MQVNNDTQNWCDTALNTPNTTIHVKRSDVDYFHTPNALGRLARPVIHQGEVSDDESLYRKVRERAGDKPVVVMGSGWNAAERFTVEMTPDEFCTHWRGD